MRSVNLIVSHLFPRLGMERAALELRDLLAARGYAVNLILLGGDDRDLKLAGVPANVCGAPMRGAQRLNVWRAKRIEKYENPAATTILVGIWAALPYLLFQSRRQRRVIVWEHSLISEKIRTTPTLRILQCIAKFLYRRASLVVAVSEPQARELAKMSRRINVTCIPNLVDLNVSIPLDLNLELNQPGHAVPRVLMIGSLTQTKNQAAAIQAMAFSTASAMRLVLLGDGPHRQKLQHIATELGVEDAVDFKGHVSRESVDAELRQCTLFLHTAVGETFGYVYFEAARFRVPVVAVRNQVVSELIPRYIAGIVTENDPKEIARAMASTVESTPTVADFERAEAARASHFSSTRIATAWMEVIDG